MHKGHEKMALKMCACTFVTKIETKASSWQLKLQLSAIATSAM